MKKVVIIGGLGDGLVIAESIKRSDHLWLAGFLNNEYGSSQEINGFPVLGVAEQWESLDSSLYYIFAIHKIKKSKLRYNYIKSLGIPKNKLINVIDPRATLAENVKMGVGIYIGPNVTVQPNSIISDHVTIRASANLGHDVEIGCFAYVGPNVTLCGKSGIKEGAHIGPNACITDQVVVSEYSVVGGCSLVTKNVAANKLVLGVPAKEI